MARACTYKDISVMVRARKYKKAGAAGGSEEAKSLASWHCLWRKHWGFIISCSVLTDGFQQVAFAKPGSGKEDKNRREGRGNLI